MICVAPFAQLVTRRTAAFRNTVGDAGEPGPALAAGAGYDRHRARARPQIAMPAGLAQRLSRGENPRAAHQPLLHRLGKAGIGTPGVADCRKPAPQHAFEDPRRLQRDEADRLLREPHQYLVDRDDMDMRIDQPRHQGMPGKIDEFRRLAFDRPVGDFADQSALDKHVMVFTRLARGSVEHRTIGEHDCGHGSALPRTSLKRMPEPRNRKCLGSRCLLSGAEPPKML